VGNDTRISKALVDRWGMNLGYPRRSTGQVGNGIQLNSGKGKAFLFSILADLSHQGLKRRYLKGYYGSRKTKSLDGYLNPIRESSGSPLNAQKPLKSDKGIPELLPLSLTTITMFSILRQNPCK